MSLSTSERLLEEMYIERFGEFVVWPYGGGLDAKGRIELLKEALVKGEPIDMEDVEWITVEP